MTANLTMRQAAQVAGIEYETFRKAWKRMARDVGFPAPFRDTRPFKWDADAVTTWRTRRAAAVGERLIVPPSSGAANDHLPTDAPSRPQPRLDAQRAAIFERLCGGRA